MADNQVYDRAFYESRESKTGHAANVILEVVRDLLKKPKHVVDLGCGNGVFLKVCKEKFGASVTGCDGPWVPRELLVIDEEEFVVVDFDKNIKVGERSVGFDLAICLEFVEHVEDATGKEVISWMTRNSKAVLFSAAIPGQGGAGHVNEQQQSYWVNYFERLGWGCHDKIRWKIWHDKKIPYWYRQNVFLFTPGAESMSDEQKAMLDVAHPDVLLLRKQKIYELKKSQRRTISGLTRSVLRKLRMA